MVNRLWPLKRPFCYNTPSVECEYLLGGSVLGDGFGSLRDGMLGQFSRKEKPDSSLDLPGGDGRPLVVVSKAAGLSGNALKDVINKGVHDAHGLGGDTSVGMDLLQHLVDVDGVRLLAFALLLVVSLGDLLLGLSSLLGGFSGKLGRHDCEDAQSLQFNW